MQLRYWISFGINTVLITYLLRTYTIQSTYLSVDLLIYSLFDLCSLALMPLTCFLSLSSRLQMSNTFYEAAGQNWFTLDSVHIHYNWTQEATFNASEVYAPATSSYHCQHVSSLHKYDTLLVPSSHTDTSANWHITFTDFQVQSCRTGNTKTLFF